MGGGGAALGGKARVVGADTCEVLQILQLLLGSYSGGRCGGGGIAVDIVGSLWGIAPGLVLVAGLAVAVVEVKVVSGISSVAAAVSLPR